MRLLLGGGGNIEDEVDIHKLLIRLIPDNKKLLYIPIAMPQENHTPNNCFKWINTSYNKLGFNRIEMWTNLKNKKYKDLDQFGGIFIGGGNTYKLLYELKETGFIKLLKKFIESDRPYYGGSAGAIIIGKDITTSTLGGCDDVNKTRLNDLSGLNLLKDYHINCHYEQKYENEIINYVKKTPGSCWVKG